MRPLHTFSDRDLKLISAYIDAELSDRQARALLHRFDVEPELKQAYLEMKQMVRTLRGLKPLPVPRNFTVTLEMLGEKKRRAFPMLQFATGLTALVFTILVGGDVLVHRFMEMSSNMALAPAMEMVAEVEIPNKVAGEAPVSEPRAVAPEVSAQESLGGAIEIEEEAPMPAVVEEAVAAEDQVADHEVSTTVAESVEGEAMPADRIEEPVTTDQTAEGSYFGENQTGATSTEAEPVQADVPDADVLEGQREGPGSFIEPDPLSVGIAFIQTYGLRMLEFGLGALVLILVAVNVHRRTRFHG